MISNIDEFIENHNHTKYCEAIIHPSGIIEYAYPSHVSALLRATGESEEVIYYEKMTVYDSPLHWLIDYTGCIGVWYDFQIFPKELTKPQKIVLRKLKMNGIIR